MVLSPFSQALTSLLLSFAMMGLVYPYYCLYGKRLESLSYSRWGSSHFWSCFMFHLCCLAILADRLADCIFRKQSNPMQKMI